MQRRWNPIGRGRGHYSTWDIVPAETKPWPCKHSQWLKTVSRRLCVPSTLSYSPLLYVYEPASLIYLAEAPSSSLPFLTTVTLLKCLSARWINGGWFKTFKCTTCAAVRWKKKKNWATGGLGCEVTVAIYCKVLSQFVDNVWQSSSFTKPSLNGCWRKIRMTTGGFTNTGYRIRSTHKRHKIS